MSDTPDDPPNLRKEELFFHKSPEEFALINKAANKIGLMAHIFEIIGEAGDPDMEISFELVPSKERNLKC